GGPAVMPSVDFFGMSDRELTDTIAYIRSLPKVDNETPPLELGPMLKVLIASGTFPFSADLHPGHDQEHRREPPPEADTLAFGEHLTRACTGCHKQDLTGGAVPGAPPDWAPAADLTRLKGWTYEDFERAMREGVRPDGSPLRTPMDNAIKVFGKMRDGELK